MYFYRNNLIIIRIITSRNVTLTHDGRVDGQSFALIVIFLQAKLVPQGHHLRHHPHQQMRCMPEGAQRWVLKIDVLYSVWDLRKRGI